MNENNTEKVYEPVTDGFHTCRIVFAKRAEKHFGKDIIGHVVFDVWLAATDTDVENPAAYKAELPVMLIPGFDWDFYDQTAGKSVTRKVTADDTKRTIEGIQKTFPAWKEYCDGLPEGSDELAFGWFANRDLTEGVTVRAKLSRGGFYTGSDGLEHEKLNARIYAPRDAKPMIADNESRQIANALKAANIKLFGRPKAATAESVMSMKPTTPKPIVPIAAKPFKTIDAARDEAIAAYRDVFTDDKDCKGFYQKCADILGREVLSWDTWTVADWENITKGIDALDDMPF